MLLQDATFVVTDTETTGSRPGDDRLIEVAAVKVVGGAVVDTFQQLINPGRHVPARITRLTGITTAMLFGKPSASRVLEDFSDFLGDGILVAHNLPFDRRFLEVEMTAAGLEPMHNQMLCTLRLARRLLSALPSKGLAALCAYYGIENRARHRALGDAEATADVLIRLLERLRLEYDVQSLGDLLTFQHRRYAETRREAAHLAHIREEVLPLLPDAPGVYFMRDRQERIIYVGKAKSLKNRVRSYFSGVDAHLPRTRKMLRSVRSVTWLETGTELAALLDESRLIKQLLPSYNRAQKKYRDYPFVRLDVNSNFPTVEWTPVIRNDGAEYYGPLSGRQQAEELVDLIGHLFHLRPCDDETLALGEPCNFARRGRCMAPCAGGSGAEAYPDAVAQVRGFLAGNNLGVLDVIDGAMRNAAEERNYEMAAWYRDQLRRLERVVARQEQIAAAIHDQHLVLIEPLADESGHQLFVIRHGRLVERWDLRAPVTGAAIDVLRAKMREHFGTASDAPDYHARSDVDEMRLLAYWLRHYASQTSQIRFSHGEAPVDLADRIVQAVGKDSHLDMPADAEGREFSEASPVGSRYSV